MEYGFFSWGKENQSNGIWIIHKVVHYFKRKTKILYKTVEESFYLR